MKHFYMLFLLLLTLSGWIYVADAEDASTWMPDANLRTAVRSALDLGHQSEGDYTHRSRAAYWDGRNGFGERVASGIYFYQLRTDNMSLLRKMLILK